MLQCCLFILCCSTSRRNFSHHVAFVQSWSKTSNQLTVVFQMFGRPPQVPGSNSSDASSSGMQYGGGISGGHSASHAALDSSGTLRDTLTSAVNWRCGQAEYDTFISNLALPPDILQSLAEVDQASRLKIFRSTWQTKPEYPSAWISKCIERHWNSRSKGAGRGTPYHREMAPVPQTPRQSLTNAAGPPMHHGTPGSTPSPLSSHVSVGVFSATHPAASATRGRADVQSPRQLFASSSTPSAPEWIVQMRNQFGNRGFMLRSLFKQLSPDMLAKITALGNNEQVFIAASVLFNPKAWSTPDVHVARCMEILSSLDNLSAVSTGMPQFEPPLIKFVAITVGYGIGLGHMALHAAAQQLSTEGTNARVQLVNVYSFEVNQKSVEVEQKVVKALGWSLTPCGDAQLLLEFVQQHASKWEGCKILLLTRLPKPKISASTTEVFAGEGSALHKVGSRLAHQIVQVLQFFQRQQKDSIVHLADIHPMQHGPDDAILDQMFGRRFTAPLAYYGATNRVHHYRTNVKLQESSVTFQHNYHKVDMKQPQDGWKWSPDASEALHGSDGEPVMNSAPSGAVVQACGEAVFDVAVVDRKMKSAIQVQQMTHQATQEKRLMSVKLWMYILGLRQTCIFNIAREDFPCFELILQVTGQKAPNGLSTAVPCGQGRWCNNCEQFLTLLGKCVHVPLHTDTLVALLKSSFQAWQAGNLDFWHECPEHEPHDCGPSCPHA